MDRMPFIPSPFMSYNPMYNPLEPIKPLESNPLKPVEYEGWGSEPITTASNPYTGSSFHPQNFNASNILSQFSPILTD